MKMISTTILIFSVAFYCQATTDLNKHELRYLADHLTNEECRKLHEALKMHHFDLDHKVTGNKEAHVPCIVLLQYWDKVEAKKSSFQILALRLKQIGRDDLADFLSRTVMKEKSAAVKRTFLGNPMKDLIAPNAPILLESPKDDPTYTREDNTKKPIMWSGLYTIVVIATVLCAIFIVFVILLKCGCIDKWNKELSEKVKERRAGKEKKEENKSLMGEESEEEEEDEDEDEIV